MNKVIKIILGILVILIPAVLVLGLLFKGLTKKSFYPDHGEIKTEGISSNVKIYNDDYGVPHILAANENDMYFTLGYMHARDRLWQMDILRRAAEGRLSEILGSSVLDFDKFFRTVGINKTAYKLYENSSPKSKEILTAYTNGVNRFMEEHMSELPVEFDALNYQPAQWKPEHSLMIGRLMGWELNIGWYTDYVFGEIINKVGIEKTSDIFPDTSVTLFKRVKIEIDTLQDSTSEEISVKNMSSLKDISSLGKNFYNINESYREFFGINNSHSGSNSWVISGSKSESGKPILANDPHLAYQAPSKWYEVQMKAGNTFDITGMTLPGVPAIIIGHNKSIAWGLTNLMNDDNDFVILDKDSTDNTKYRFKNQTIKLDSITERIPVKDSVEVEYIVRYTPIGPVISDLPKHSLITDKNNENIYKDKLLTFRWTGYEITDDINTFYSLNNAKNWDEFKNALRNFCCPAQNFMYADTAGNIGYHAAGKVPVRKSDIYDGRFYPSDVENEWTGFVDFDKLPNLFNPQEGYIITANTNPWTWLKTESNDKFYISYYWESSSRFDRINDMLKSSTKFNTEEFKLIQMNTQSVYAQNISKFLLDAYKDSKNIDPVVYSALEKFRKWDGDMHHNEPEGALFNVFFVYFIKNIYNDELGDDVFKDYLSIGILPYNSTIRLLNSKIEESQLWFDNINTTPIETKEEIIRKSFNEAIDYLRKRFNTDDIGAWRWGELHTIKFNHILGSVAALDKTFNIGTFETGGDQTTVNCSEYNFYDAYKNGKFDIKLGPSMRIITDMADVSHSLSVNTTGQSGQPLHDNYSDQSRMWLYGEYKKMVMDEIEMVNKRYKLLTLVPK
ncbi:MAG: penicillin acylase family protein [Ignavibacteriae bacterium]|nr:MAG: penicillin acylase family protein [Ignavibacteriota bacterium]